MNRFFKKSLACTLAGVTLMSCALPMADTGLFSSTIATAATSTVYTSGSFRFTVSGSDATITGFTGSGSVTIPKTLTANSVAYNVTAIGDSAFKGKAITTLSASTATYLTTINYQAFYGCTSLTSVSLPYSLQTISTQAFSGCTRLSTVTLNGAPKLGEIGTKAFYNCRSLTKFYAPSEYTINCIYNYAYFPKSVWRIGSDCYTGCTNLQKIYLHDENNLSMGDNVFPYTNSYFGLIAINEMAKTYTPPVEKIDDQYVTAADGNQYRYNFVDMMDHSRGIIVKEVTVNRAAVSVPASISYGGKSYAVTEISTDFMHSNSKATSLVFPDSVKKIGDWVCAYASTLTTVTLPKNVETIGYASFYGMTKLNKVKYTGTTLNCVNDFGFRNTPWMNNYEANHPKADAVMLGNYLIKYLGDKYSGSNSGTTPKERNIECKTGLYTYNDYTGSYVKSPITGIGFSAFSDSSKTYLKTIDLTGVKKVYDGAFSNCPKLESVYYTTGALDHMGKNLFHANTIKKLKETTSNQNYIMMGNVLYQWLGTGTTADLSSMSSLTFIPQSAFENTNVTTLKLPKQTTLKMQSVCFINTKIANIYVGGYQYTYANVKNNAGGFMKAFYERNYDPLEGCQATKNNFLLPLCKEILGQIGLTYYGKAQTTLTPQQQQKIVGTTYRYFEKNFRYVYTIGGSGEYTLYSKLGECGPHARAYSYLLNAAGVSAQIVGGPGHAWTAVKIGSKWMHVDACSTWSNLGSWLLRTTDEIAKNDSVNHLYYGDGVSDDMATVAYGFVTKGTPKPVCNQPMGDMDGDGDVDAADLERLRTKLNYPNASISTTYADLNGDGKVTSLDKTYLEYRLANK